MSDGEDFSVALNSQIFKKLKYVYCIKRILFPYTQWNGRSACKSIKSLISVNF